VPLLSRQFQRPRPQCGFVPCFPRVMCLPGSKLTSSSRQQLSNSIRSHQFLGVSRCPGPLRGAILRSHTSRSSGPWTQMVGALFPSQPPTSTVEVRLASPLNQDPRLWFVFVLCSCHPATALRASLSGRKSSSRLRLRILLWTIWWSRPKRGSPCLGCACVTTFRSRSTSMRSSSPRALIFSVSTSLWPSTTVGAQFRSHWILVLSASCASDQFLKELQHT